MDNRARWEQERSKMTRWEEYLMVRDIVAGVMSAYQNNREIRRSIDRIWEGSDSISKHKRMLRALEELVELLYEEGYEAGPGTFWPIDEEDEDDDEM